MDGLKVKIEEGQEELTDEQLAEIEKEANADYDAMKEGREVENKEPVEEENAEEDKAEEEPEEKEDAEPKTDQEEGQEGAKEEGKEEDKEASEEGLDDETVKAYALKHEITEDDAKKEIKKDRDTLKFYQSPEALARSHRKLQSEHDSLKAKMEKGDNVIQPETDLRSAQETIKEHIDKNRDNVIEKFRQQFPAKSELMTDDAIVEEVADKYTQRYELWAKEKSIENKQLAADKREVIINNLKDNEKEFIADIKAALKEISDTIILDEEYDASDIVRWAKGGKFDEKVKSAFDEGYRKGKEEAKILGERVPTKPKGGTVGKTGSDRVISLNEVQQERARNMFDIPGLSDKEKYDMYRETFKEDLRKNPKYVG